MNLTIAWIDRKTGNRHEQVVPNDNIQVGIPPRSAEEAGTDVPALVVHVTPEGVITRLNENSLVIGAINFKNRLENHALRVECEPPL